ncbi:MAG: hypothetical protein K2X82_01560, partial [Gemmataceae bacterium]|nr:hypothetical protein [Gemmataceae bacterium]
RAGSVRAAGRLTATWSGAGTFRAATLSAPAATVRDAAGNVVGSGAVALSAAAELAVAGGTYRVTGNGSLSFYGPAGAALGAGGDWADYSAAVTGNPTFTTSGGLTLNGTALPAGTYTITAASATLTGRGATSAPTFAGSASVAVTDGAVNVGPGTGNLSVGGAALDPAAETTLDGYTGTLTVTGDGSDADAVTLDGTAAHVLRVTAPAGLAADQNTPVTFRAAVGTSLGGDYTISAEAPAGWAVAVDAAGNVTVTPAPGSPAGSYPVRVVARSNANPDLVAQTAAAVAVAATAPGLTLVVTADPVFTAPYAGAQIPTSFQAAVRNLGPAADGYTVAASNVPAGFEVVTSRGGPLTIPAGRPGVVGLYLRPVAGAVLPAPGTPLSFTVTATSATDPTLTRTQTVSFTMPEAHGVTVAVDPAGAGATPGTTVAGTLTLRAVGNVAETVNLLTVLPTGLTLAGLSATATLQPGQSVALPFTLTVAADTPLNTTLTAGLTARFSPLGEAFDVNVRIPVRVAVPGAAAIGTAAEAAGRLGQPDLAARLRELSTALTGLVQYPASRVYKGQATAALDTIARLLAANQDLADLAPPVRADAAALTAAVTPAAIQAAVVALGNTLGVTGATLADAADTRFTIGFERNSQVGRPQVGAEYRLVLQNTGAATTTYDLAVTGLPAGVTTAFSQTSITLDPGQVTPGAGVPTVTLTLTSTSATDLVPFGFTVTATARGAARVARSAAGEFTVRDALVRVPVVATDPPFTDPGGTVRVTARILNAVNKQQDARASFTVTAPGGAVVFTSTPVAVTLNVLTTLTTADLGTFDTTGFARGDYAIAVTVTDAAGTPISGATGSGALLVGTPVSATLSTTPDAAPAGTATVATTLQATSRETFAAPLTPVGTVAIPGAAAVVTRGDRAYVAGTGGIRVVNVADPTNPQVLSTFGAEDIPAGLGIGALELDGDRLVAMINKFDATPDNKIVIYSLADPDAPVRLGQTPLTVGGIDPTGLAPFAVVDHRVYTAAFWYRRFIFGNNVFGQWGESVVVDISDPAAPAVVDVVYNRTPEPNYVYPDGLRWPDGTSNIWQIAGAGRSTVLVGTTANTKNVVNDKGQILVVDNTNPNDPEVVRTLDVPGMSVVTGIAVSGTTGLVIGSSLGWYSGYGPVGLNGKVVAARIDLTDPRNPVLGPTRTFDIDSFGMHYLERTDNGLYVTNSVDPATNAARLLVFDPRGAGDVTVTPVPIPAGIGADSFGTAGNLVLTGDGSNLIIYEFGEAAGTPATARVTVPAGVTAAGFNTAPTRTVANPDGSQTLEWDVAFGSGNTSRTFTWQSTVTGLQPGGSAVVAVNGEVTFTSGGADGTVPLPDQVVAGRQVIGITPAARTVAPGAATTYAVTLANPTAADVTYTLSAQGVPAGWVGLPPTAAVPANGTADVTLTLTPPAFAALQDYGFSVTATAGGATGSAPATLTVAGTPVAPDPESHGVVVRLMTATATAGQGVSARYVVRLTNTGSATETFALTAALPAGVTGAFDRASVEVPPGVGNFREVVLVVTPAAGTRGGAYPVDVTAASADATGTAAGSLAVTTAGVSVALDR